MIETTVGQRLRKMAEDKWGKRGAIKKLADALGIKMSNLYIYLNDKSSPGSDVLLKLNELDFDLSILLTGKPANTPAEAFNAPYNYLNELDKKKAEIKALNEKIKNLEKKVAKYEKVVKIIKDV